MGVSLFAPRRSLASDGGSKAASSEAPSTSDRDAGGASAARSKGSRSRDDAAGAKDGARSKDDAIRRKDEALRSKDAGRSKDGAGRSKDGASRSKDGASRSKDDGSRSKDDAATSKETTPPPLVHGYAREAAALLLLASALYTSLALGSFRGDPMRLEIVGDDWVGPVGAVVAGALVQSVGVCAWLVPFGLAVFATPLLQGKPSKVSLVRIAGDLVVMLVAAALLHVAFPKTTSFGLMPIGGSAGELFGEVMRALFSTIGSYIVGLTVVSLILIGRAAFSIIDWYQRAQERARLLGERSHGGLRALVGAWDEARALEEKRKDEERRAGEPVITEACDDAIFAALADDSPAPFPRVKPLELAAAGASARISLGGAAMGGGASISGGSGPARPSGGSAPSPVVAGPFIAGMGAVSGDPIAADLPANRGAVVGSLARAVRAEAPTPTPAAAKAERAKRGRKKGSADAIAVGSLDAIPEALDASSDLAGGAIDSGAALDQDILAATSTPDRAPTTVASPGAPLPEIQPSIVLGARAEKTLEKKVIRAIMEPAAPAPRGVVEEVAGALDEIDTPVVDIAPAPLPAPPPPRVEEPRRVAIAAPPPPKPVEPAPPPEPVIVDTSAALKAQKPTEIVRVVPAIGEGFRLPPTDMLDEGPTGRVLLDEDQLKQTAIQLEKVLADYGVSGKVEEIHPGPTVTTFEVSPAAGTKVSKVASLADDLALGLSRKVRIVAPIPGKNRIGFEVPNDRRLPVVMRELVEDKRFLDMKAPLPCVLGRDIIGAPFFADLASMPHVIVAGATGAGKSVGLNVMLISLLYRRTPAELRLLMIDPKVVELAPFDGIPHMLLPVVTDMKQASNALKWAVDEMERRYQLFANAGTRNITSYNGWVERVRRGEIRAPKKTQPKVVNAFAPDGTDVEIPPADDGSDYELPETLPFIVIVVDEFADLMMQQGKEVEASVARLAQKARAAGMHVILATQRPSVDVITGMIKANFPTRIAFRVAQKVDSRTILDEQGAEHLLGRGDMLVKMNGSNDTRRVQCPFCSEEEVQRVTDFLRLQGTPVYDENILKPRDEDGEGDVAEDDELDQMYDAAVRIVADTRRCSTSWLQRKLGIGYNRAAKMVEAMEKRGVVGPANGAKDREVLIGTL